MPINVGAVEITVVPSVRSFAKDIRARLLPEARALGRDLGTEVRRGITDSLRLDLPADPVKAAETGRKIGADVQRGLDTSQPEVKPQVDMAEAQAKMKWLTRDEDVSLVVDAQRVAETEAKLDALARPRKVKVTAEVSGLNKALGGANVPWLAAAAPLALPLGGYAAGAGLGLGATAVAGGAALGLYGAVAKSVISGALGYNNALDKVQSAYALAIKQAQVSYTASVSGASGKGAAATVQRAQLQLDAARTRALNTQNAAIADALQGQSPAIIGFAKQLDGLKSAWQDFRNSLVTPVADSLTPWLKAATDAMTAARPAVEATAPAVAAIGTAAQGLFTGPGADKFWAFVAGSGSLTVKDLGVGIVDFVKGLEELLPVLAPSVDRISGGFLGWGKAFERWAGSAQARKDITGLMAYMRTEGPVIEGILRGVGQALAGVAPGLSAAGQLELRVLDGLVTLLAHLPPSWQKTIGLLTGLLLVAGKFGGFKLAAKVDLLGKGWALLTWIMAGAPGGAAAFKSIFKGAATTAAGQAAGTAAGSGEAAAAGAMAPTVAAVIGTGVVAAAATALATYIVTTMIQRNWNDFPSWIQKLLTQGGQTPSSNFFKAWEQLFLGPAGSIGGAAQAIADQVQGLGSTGAAGPLKYTAGAVRDLIAQYPALSRAPQAFLDVQNLTAAIKDQGVKSLAAAGARAKLISDLQHAGFSARDAKVLVDKLQASITGLHGKNIPINVAFKQQFLGPLTPGQLYNAMFATNPSTGQAIRVPASALTSRPGHAAGTLSASAGWAWVGERGPELMRMRGGEEIMSHARSIAALSNPRGLEGTAGGDEALSRLDRMLAQGDRAERQRDAQLAQVRQLGRAIETGGRTASYRALYGGR